MQVDISKCPKMEIFCQGLIRADCFRGIQASSDPNDELVLSNDVNSSAKEVFLRQGFISAVEEKYFSINLSGKVGLQCKRLCYLLTLKLSNYTLPYAIPSTILPCLKNLRELEVLDSDKVEIIFDMNYTEIMETTSQLKKLTLQQLSSLVHVWKKNSHGVLVSENLQEVIVSDCENLQTLFPASLAKNLQNLEKLKIQSCHKLQAIVENEESTAADITEEFVFPCLEKLKFSYMSRFTCFYPQTFTVECPVLNKLYVLDCPNLELFQNAHRMGESTSINRQPLISNLKVISKLKKLELDWKQISALTLRFRSEEFPEGLNYLETINLCFMSDENEKVLLPIEILGKAPNLIEMRISYCNVPETLLGQNLKIGEDGMLGHLNKLMIFRVSAESEDSSWLNTICEKIHILYVRNCPDLTTLVHTVSFSCLKKLHMSNCPQLQYLFTSSAAKKLMNLEEMTVKECESMKEIVAKDSKEGDEDELKGEGGNKYENEMIFRKLEFLMLSSLPKLVSFYMGSSTLNLLSLKEVWFIQCYSTKVFRLHDKLPVNFKVKIDGFYRYGDIHSVIMQQLEEEAA